MDAFEDLIDFVRNGDTSKPMYRVDLDEKIRLAREAKYCSEECARDANTPRTTRGKKIDVSKLAAK